MSVPTYLLGQEIKNINTSISDDLDFGVKVQNDWKRINKLFSSNKDWKDFTKEEIDLIDKYDAEIMENMWDILGGGCSWYCGAGEYSVRTSSSLKDSNVATYNSSNLRDFSYKTAWVEGVKGHGIGEYIEFDFVPTHPRITEIIIVNGYVKSKKVWKNNSRVKKLKMYLDNEPYAIISLQDVYAEQSFTVNPIGYSRRDDFKELGGKPNFKLRFEILEIYEGDKYDDTAITEIYFNGLDVH